MADFENVTTLIIPAEGSKYVDQRSDLGGPTKYGITKRSYPLLDIKNLTFPDALKIYERDYWNKYNLGQIINQTLANKIFLMAINLKPETWATILQNAINATNGLVMTDGIFGDKTLRALNSASPGWLLDRIRVELCKHYAGRVRDNVTQIANLEGWIWRAVS